MQVNIEAEAARLKAIMDSNDCCNIFLSEGAGVESIVKEMGEAFSNAFLAHECCWPRHSLALPVVVIF